MQQISISIKYAIGSTVQWRVDGVEHKGRVEKVHADIDGFSGYTEIVEGEKIEGYRVNIVYTVLDFASWKMVDVNQKDTNELRIITFKKPTDGQ